MTFALGEIQFAPFQPQRTIVGVTVGNPGYQYLKSARISSTSTASITWGTPVKLVSIVTGNNTQGSVAIVDKASATDDVFGVVIFTPDRGSATTPFTARESVTILRPSISSIIRLQAGAVIDCSLGEVAVMYDATNNKIIPYVNNGSNKILGYATENAVLNSIVEVRLSSGKVL